MAITIVDNIKGFFKILTLKASILHKTSSIPSIHKGRRKK